MFGCSRIVVLAWLIGALLSPLAAHAADPQREALSNELVRVNAPMAALKDRYPEFYEEMLDIYVNGIRARHSADQVRTATRTKFRNFVNGLLPKADDDVLIEFATEQAEQFELIGPVNGTACYEYVSRKAFDDYGRLLTLPQIKKEQAVVDRVIRTAAPRGATDNAAAWQRLTEAMSAKGFGQSELQWLKTATVGTADHARYCAMFATLMRLVVELPKAQAAGVLREIHAPN